MSDDQLDLDILRTVTDAFVAACRRVSPQQLRAGTPCPDWDVSEVIDHVTGGNRFTIALLEGEEGEAALGLAMASFADSHEVVTSGIDSAISQRSAFLDPGALSRPCRHLIGDLTGRQVLRLRLHDLIVHTWDLHEALGSDSAIPSAHVDWAAAELSDSRSVTARLFATIDDLDLRSEGAILKAFGRERMSRRE